MAKASQKRYLQKDKMLDVQQMIMDVEELETQREQLEMALYDSEEEIQQLQRMVGIANLAGGIAHHFNNIMTVVTGYGSMLQKALRKEDPLRGYVDRIVSASERAAQLTKKLLDISGQMIIKPRLTELNDTIRRAERLLPKCASDNVDVKLELADRELPVSLDIFRIEEVLSSLVTNACEAMPDGGKLTISTGYVNVGNGGNGGETGICARLSLADTGAGMDKRTTIKSLEPFYTTKGVGKHIGLGLSVAYAIVKQHNGSMTIESKPGKGTTVNLFFPLAKTRRTGRRPIPLVSSVLSKRPRICKGL
ncbi:MAG: histidine kinase [Deltaproteobacteria bacterium]|nr:histidine kinase [Deltaproteobacteria bacterium]